MGFNSASFGIYVTEHGDVDDLMKLLFKEVIFFDTEGKKLDSITCVNDIEFVSEFGEDVEEGNEQKIVSKIGLVPYDDFILGGEVPGYKEIESFEEFDEEYFSTIPIEWKEGVKMFSIGGCRVVLGFGEVSRNGVSYNISISAEQMKQLQTLHDRLLSEGRIKGGFALVGNCCS